MDKRTRSVDEDKIPRECDSTSESESSSSSLASSEQQRQQKQDAPNMEGLSKNQQKKLLKLQARGGIEGMRTFWKEKKIEAKQRRKVQRVEKKKTDQQQWEQLSEAERAEIQARAAEKHEMRRRAAQRHDALCSVRLAAASTAPVLCFDMNFSHMIERDVRSTVAQLKISYSTLRRAGFCMVPHFIGNGSNLQGLLKSSTEWFAKYGAVFDDRPWNVVYDVQPRTSKTSEENTTGAAKNSSNSADATKSKKAKRKIVYLTADSECVLQRIEADHVYVVGAFVDHNSKKGLALSVAEEFEVVTARLPIEETLQSALGNTCKVLTINAVTDVLVRFIERNDWSYAMSALPTRRNNEAKGSTKTPHDDSDHE